MKKKKVENSFSLPSKKEGERVKLGGDISPSWLFRKKRVEKSIKTIRLRG